MGVPDEREWFVFGAVPLTITISNPSLYDFRRWPACLRSSHRFLNCFSFSELIHLRR
jgi:hypothetical protein